MTTSTPGASSRSCSASRRAGRSWPSPTLAVRMSTRGDIAGNVWQTRTVTALVVLIASVAALDSLNPSTVGPALFLAVDRRPARAVGAFAAGVAAVSILGGVAL